MRVEVVNSSEWYLPLLVRSLPSPKAYKKVLRIEIDMKVKRGRLIRGKAREEHWKVKKKDWISWKECFLFLW